MISWVDVTFVKTLRIILFCGLDNGLNSWLNLPIFTYLILSSMERQINIYSNICTYLQIFEPRYKSFVPRYKSIVPRYKWFEDRYKWFVPRYKWFVPIFKYSYLYLSLNDLYLGPNDLNLSSNHLWICSICT